MTWPMSLCDKQRQGFLGLYYSLCHLRLQVSDSALCFSGYFSKGCYQNVVQSLSKNDQTRRGSDVDVAYM